MMKFNNFNDYDVSSQGFLFSSVENNNNLNEHDDEENDFDDEEQIYFEREFD